ncbi:hypothetical protein WH52_04670 [Tenacibaculum holothuriorum]|uniref:Uncharacterized protein n=1 Tax=Tenacibaculum holothuriorum TaxID=1635173 RepID=A0A1Y2PG29_9FLAO|nr:T9SS type A sorting domain-containing protein [Tenacibaculum holothuriorum]OSY88961.1 hypothetical protein WH52_04670 [Tenacibaculum holothuriorum]
MIKKILFFLLFYSAFLHAQDYKEIIQKGTYTLSEIQKKANAYFKLKGKGRGSGYKQYKRWEYNAIRLQSEEGKLLSNHYYAREFSRFNSYLNKSRSKSQSPSGLWEQLGPTNYTNGDGGYNPGVGRITSIAIHPNNSNIIIIGAETGGVWKSTDKGNTWNPLSDQFSTMKVYALTIDPQNPDIYFWGSDQGKIYKSNNAGNTWQQLTTIGHNKVNKILIQPNNNQKVFASVKGSGIFKSNNGGSSWSRIISSEDNGFDIEFKPGDFNTIYASGEKFHKSSDGGNSWTTISGFDNTGVKMIGVSPANKNIVYVLEAKNSSSSFNAIYISNNSGTSFIKRNHSDKNYFGYAVEGNDLDVGQAPRDMAIAVSPTNSNEVHIAGINSWRSLNGGISFSPTSNWNLQGAQNSNLGYCHADVDDLLFNGTDLYAVTDGGIFIATKSAEAITTNYYKDITSGLGIHQFYKIGISQTNPVVISGGSQDNGTTAFINGNTWKHWVGADGMESFIDKKNKQIFYGTQQSGALVKSIDNGDSYEELNAPEKEGNWITPFEQDPILNNTIYAGYTKVYKSTDGGSNWNSISQTFDLPLNQLKIASSNNKIMFASLDETLYKTTSGSGNWTEIKGFKGTINSIAINPRNPNKVAIATTSDDKVYITTDGGNTWVAKKTGLPNLAALCLVWQNNNNDGLYLGMNYGVYYTDNTLNEWKPFSNLLPNVMVNELEINYADKKLYAATYGRGAWRTPLYDSETLSTTKVSLLNDINVYPNPTASNITINWKLLDKAEIRLFNISGQLVHLKKNVLLNNYKINVENLPTGVYFLRINSVKGILTKKIIKK